MAGFVSLAPGLDYWYGVKDALHAQGYDDVYFLKVDPFQSVEVRAAGGTVAGAAVLVDRSGGAARLDVPLHALWRLDIPSYLVAECPLCAKGVPAMHPGTTPAPASVSR